MSNTMSRYLGIVGDFALGIFDDFEDCCANVVDASDENDICFVLPFELECVAKLPKPLIIKINASLGVEYENCSETLMYLLEVNYK